MCYTIYTMTNTQYEVTQVPAILTVSEAATLSKFAERTLRQAIRQGALPAGSPTGTDTRILGTDLVEWIKSTRSIRWYAGDWSVLPLSMLEGVLLDRTDSNPEDEGEAWIPSSDVIRVAINPEKLKTMQMEIRLANDVKPLPEGSIIQIPWEGVNRWNVMNVRVLAVENLGTARMLCEVLYQGEETLERIKAMVVDGWVNWDLLDNHVTHGPKKVTGRELAEFLQIKDPTSAHFREISVRMQRLGFVSKRGNVGMVYRRPGLFG